MPGSTPYSVRIRVRGSSSVAWRLMVLTAMAVDSARQKMACTSSRRLDKRCFVEQVGIRTLGAHGGWDTREWAPGSMAGGDWRARRSGRGLSGALDGWTFAVECIWGWLGVLLVLTAVCALFSRGLKLLLFGSFGLWMIQHMEP